MSPAAQHHPALEGIDAQLCAFGIPTYSELLSLLNEVNRVALDLDIGRAYISRAYIDRQAALSERIKRVNQSCSPAGESK